MSGLYCPSTEERRLRPKVAPSRDPIQGLRNPTALYVMLVTRGSEFLLGQEPRTPGILFVGSRESVSGRRNSVLGGPPAKTSFYTATLYIIPVFGPIFGPPAKTGFYTATLYIIPPPPGGPANGGAIFSHFVHLA